MSATRSSEGVCWDCGGGVTCMHCHPVDRPTQTLRIAELERERDGLRQALAVMLAEADRRIALRPELGGMTVRVVREIEAAEWRIADLAAENEAFRRAMNVLLRPVEPPGEDPPVPCHSGCD